MATEQQANATQPNAPDPMARGGSEPQSSPAPEAREREIDGQMRGDEMTELADKDRDRRTLERLGQFVAKPSVGGSITGTVVLGVAAAFGIAEAALAAGVGYVAYRILRKNKPAQPVADEPRRTP